MRDGAIAIVERRDGFYELFKRRRASRAGPPGKQGDRRSLAAPRSTTSAARRWSTMRRSWCALKAQLSEMFRRCTLAMTARRRFSLERGAYRVVIDLDRATTEIQRAIKCDNNGRPRELIAALDLTTPGLGRCTLHAAENKEFET